MAHVLPSYPAVHMHSTEPTSPAAALRLLDDYLARSAEDASLHPDARITPGGVTFPASHGPQGSLQVSQLRRVAAGLKGDDVALDSAALGELLLLAPDGSRGDTTARGGKRRRDAGEASDSGVGAAVDGIGSSGRKSSLGTDGKARKGVLKKRTSGGLGAADGDMATDRDDGAGDGQAESSPGDAMDMEEYAQSREVLEGDVGDRDGAPVVSQGDDAQPPEIATHAAPPFDERGRPRRETPRRSEADKEARKAEKKRRKKEVQREENERRRNAKVV